MTVKLLSETGSKPLARHGAQWRAVLLTPGEGSSGIYSEALLERDAATAFPKGSHNYVNHLKEGEIRDPRLMWGVLAEDAKYVKGVGVVADIDVMPHWKDFVEAVAPHTGLSISSMGEADEDKNVTKLIPDRQNSVDLVSYAGRPGSGLVEQLFESALAVSSPTPDSASDQVTKEGKMDREILEALNALKTSFDTFVTETRTAATATVQAEADADAIASAVESAVTSYDEKVKAIDAAKDLLPSQVESLRVEALAGKDVKPLIEAAEKFVAEAKTAFEVEESAPAGRTVGGATGTAAPVPNVWS